MSFRQYSLVNYTAATDDCAVPIPVGAAVGDIAIVRIFTVAAITTLTAPSGFTALTPVSSTGTDPVTLQWYWKRIASGDVLTGSWVFDFNLQSTDRWGLCELWAGRIGTGSPFAFTTQAGVHATQPTNLTGTATAGADLAYGFGEWNGVTTGMTLAGWTTQLNQTSGHHLLTKESVGAGSVSAQLAATTANTWLVTLAALKAAGLTADAGPDQSVNATNTVTMAGAAAGGTSPYTWAWTQTAGTSVTLSSSTAQNPTFTAPATANVTVSARPAGTPAAPIHTTIKPWAPATSVVVPLTATTTSGNSLVAVVTVRNAAVYTTPITDDAGNIWLYATSTRAVTGLGQPVRQFIYYTSRAAPVTTLTASFLDSTPTAISAAGEIHVLEFAGDMSAPTGINQGGNVTTDPTPYGVTVGSGASAIVIGGLALGVTDRVWTVASTWTSDGHDGTRTDVDQYVGYKIVTGPATTGPSWTRTAGTQTDTAQTTIAFAGGVPVPIASGGVTQAVSTGAGVTLHASATGGTSPYTWAWTQTKGTTVTLSSNTSATPTFTAAVAGTYWFALATAVVVASAPGTGLPLVRSGGAWVPVVAVKVRSGGVWL